MRLNRFAVTALADNGSLPNDRPTTRSHAHDASGGGLPLTCGRFFGQSSLVGAVLVDQSIERCARGEHRVGTVERRSRSRRITAIEY
jgi:hypothetical protein